VSGEFDRHVPIRKNSEVTKLWEIDGIDIGAHPVLDHSRLKDGHGDLEKDIIES
jgi:hypothetical protein